MLLQLVFLLEIGINDSKYGIFFNLIFLKINNFEILLTINNISRFYFEYFF